ncbi:hypothetical protein TNCV_2791581 [Trichonephila clavipes]|nr:hypothetical protein TNCV_2791581 [Trichonephila clavipes]
MNVCSRRNSMVSTEVPATCRLATTIGCRLPESIGTRYRSDNRKPNAIHAVYETVHYTNIENHHMRETCLKKKQNRYKMSQCYLYCGK